VTVAFTRTDTGEQGTFTVTDVTGEWVVRQRHAGADGPPSLAMRDGVAHLAFASAGRGLMHTSGLLDADDGPSWSTQVVDRTCCAGAPTLRLTATGLPRIGYPDGTGAAPTGLKLASRGAGGTWTVQVIDAGRVTRSSMVLDDADRPSAIYARRGSGTWFAARDGRAWTRRQLDAGASGQVDLAVYPGSFAFVWSGRGIVKHASFSGGILFTMTVATNRAADPHVVRHRGRPIVTFTRSGAGSLDGLWITRRV
jgi:hypothetical protein